jgi:leucyl aminopeptidase
MPVLSIDDWQGAVAPSIRKANAVDIQIVTSPPDGVVIGLPVAADGEVPAELSLDRQSVRAAGFDGEIGQTLALPRREGAAVLVGVGDAARLGLAGLRDAAAAMARATATHDHIAIELTGIDAVDPEAAGRVVVEGVTLARYRFDSLRREPDVTAITRLTLVTDDGRREAVAAGAELGRRTSEATQLARDLANSPPVLLTAARMAELAASLGPERGLDVEVFDEDALTEMGCGGLLGVNAGSAEPPRMIKLTYAPRDDAREPVEPTGRLALVGKGIMYDAGGIALKPADEVHATMKNDMSGAGAILAAMLELREARCATAVTGYLMCTDNRPSGTALAMGDVLTVRGGTTVEVVNTDAEGRLVMADALVLSREEPVDAIVDVATLTGAALRTFGARVAAVMGNDQRLVDQVIEAGAATDEPVWQLPLIREYRRQLDSPVADLKNLGGPNAGSIIAALFLEEFVDGRPWAHIDIAGTAQNDADASWRPAGCTGFGARLLIDLACDFRQTRP